MTELIEINEDNCVLNIEDFIELNGFLMEGVTDYRGKHIVNELLLKIKKLNEMAKEKQK